MSKLTKPQAKAHHEACALLTKDALTEDERWFVLENWQESATHINSAAGAFFTPPMLARDFCIEVAGHRIIDLCAGIGTLSFMLLQRRAWSREPTDIVCVEINPDYAAVGRKLVPEATWIVADMFDVPALGLGRFDCAISNPPFGKIKRSGSAPRYTGGDFEYHVVDIAADLASYGAFILPQMSAGFRYSGQQSYQRDDRGKAREFEAKTGLDLRPSCGIDASVYRGDWRGVAPAVEVVCVEFEREEAVLSTAAPAMTLPQMDLFAEAAE